VLKAAIDDSAQQLWLQHEITKARGVDTGVVALLPAFGSSCIASSSHRGLFLVIKQLFTFL
jgi:hypothetical protein